jgi:hypothetical protein
LFTALPNHEQPHELLEFVFLLWQLPQTLRTNDSRKREGVLLRVPDNIRSVHGPEGGTALDIGHGHMFSLNPTGSRILELLKSGCSEPQIVAEIIGEFGGNPETVQADIREFFVSLEEHHLVEQSRSDGSL